MANVLRPSLRLATLNLRQISAQFSSSAFLLQRFSNPSCTVSLQEWSLRQFPEQFAYSKFMVQSFLNPSCAVRRQEWGQSWLGRHMATTAARRTPGRPKLDIGARARRNQSRRLWTYGLSFGAVAGFIIVVLGSFQDYLVFYVTPTDAMEKFLSDPSKNKFRLGGLVLEGSVVEPASSTETEFVVTDLVTDILVRHKGALPDLFREGHSVVVEGFIRPCKNDGAADEGDFSPLSGGRAATEKARKNGCYFAATEVLAKHDEKYMPKEVAAAIEKNRAAIEAAHASSQQQQQSPQVQS